VVFLQYFGADDVAWHQVGCELHASKLQRQRLPERPHQQGLAQSGHALQQTVSAGQQSNQQLLDDIILTDDDLRDGLTQLFEVFDLAGNGGFVDVHAHGGLGFIRVIGDVGGG